MPAQRSGATDGLAARSRAGAGGESGEHQFLRQAWGFGWPAANHGAGPTAWPPAHGTTFSLHAGNSHFAGRLKAQSHVTQKPASAPALRQSTRPIFVV